MLRTEGHASKKLYEFMLGWLVKALFFHGHREARVQKFTGYLTFTTCKPRQFFYKSTVWAFPLGPTTSYFLFHISDSGKV